MSVESRLVSSSALDEWLRVCSSSLTALQSSAACPVHIVLGNEAADLDTCVSTLVLAHLLHLEGVRPVVPVLNVAREDLPLRPEVLAAFSQCGLRVEHLVFVDTEGGPLRRWPHRLLHLVDHNRLAPEQEFLEGDVTQILDHHNDEGRCAKTQHRRVVFPMGSCATLVAEYAFERGFTFDANVSKLLLATILVDTANLIPSRTQPLDISIVEKLSVTCDLHGETRNEFYKWISGVRVSAGELLSEYDALRRDYKEYIVGPSSVRCGMSAMVRLVGSYDSKAFAEAVHKWMKARNLHVLFVMASAVENNVPKREDFIFSQTQHLHEFLIGVMEKSFPVKRIASVGLDGAAEFIVAFEHADGTIRRKQVQPPVCDALEKYTLLK